jgi:segregation and condensation protein A
MEALTYKLEQFEGPLDLLLSLISKNKVSITDIPISLICDQYMEYISQAEASDMDLAADFLVMASELMYIKSKMLLPRVDETEEDPRKQLSDALIQYQKAKEAAKALLPMYTSYSGRMIKDEDEITPDHELPTDLDTALLSRAMAVMLARIKTQELSPRLITPLIKTRTISVADKINEIDKALRLQGKMSFAQLMLSQATKEEMIASFMALLEMIKERRVIIQADSSEDMLPSDPCEICLEIGEDPENEIDTDVSDGEV